MLVEHCQAGELGETPEIDRHVKLKCGEQSRLVMGGLVIDPQSTEVAFAFLTQRPRVRIPASTRTHLVILMDFANAVSCEGLKSIPATSKT